MIKVEVCVESLESALTGLRAGAHRIELNSAIGLGGLTPTANLLKQIKSQCNLPIVCMVRPRAGDFFYNEDELELMLGEAQSLIESGADGLAVGVLDGQGNVCKKSMSIFKQICRSAELVFHRAFDCTADQRSATQALIDEGVDRILTSGGETTAIAGQSKIADLVSEFGGRIEFLPGSGINRSNAQQVIEATGCDQIHGTFARVKSTGAEASAINFNDNLGLESNEKKETDLDELSAVLSAINC